MEFLGLAPAVAGLYVAVGLLVGTLFGFFGMGGSFLVTPTLLVVGLPTRVAVGSGLAFVFGTSIVGALRHHDHGHVDYRLAGLVVVGMTAGVEVGKQTVFLLGGRADAVVSVAYVLLLAFVGAGTLLDAWVDSPASVLEHLPVDFASRSLPAVNLPPVVSLAGGRRVSVWPVVGAGVGIGVLSGFLGVGGGFLLVPTMVYGFGVPVAVAAGTSVLQIAVPAAFGTFLYARADAVALPIVAPLLVGSVLGARLGARATALVDADDFTASFAAMLFAGSLAVALHRAGGVLGQQTARFASVSLLLGSAAVVAGAVGRSALAELRG